MQRVIAIPKDQPSVRARGMVGRRVSRALGVILSGLSAGAAAAILLLILGYADPRTEDYNTGRFG